MKGGICCLLLHFCISQFCAGQAVTYQDQGEKDFGKVSISIPDTAVQNFFVTEQLSFKQWASFFSITVNNSQRPVIGNYFIEDDAMVFEPRFLPDPNVVYYVRFSATSLFEMTQIDADMSDFTQKIRFKYFDLGRTQITNFFPGIDTIPANTLRLYINFSNPMGLENPYHFLKIENEEGEPISEPFVEVQEGLWDPSRTRLTLLLHPGRIKRGVGPNMTQGEIFNAGNFYTLIIDPNWKDMQGYALNESWEKRLVISKPIRTKISVQDWEVNEPRRGTKDTLLITTHRLLDRYLVSRFITIHADDGSRLTGEVTFNSVTKHIMFAPKSVWAERDYHILVDAKLEDVCGNTLLSAFDYEKRELVQGAEKSVKIPIVIK